MDAWCPLLGSDLYVEICKNIGCVSDTDEEQIQDALKQCHLFHPKTIKSRTQTRSEELKVSHERFFYSQDIKLSSSIGLHIADYIHDRSPIRTLQLSYILSTFSFSLLCINLLFSLIHFLTFYSIFSFSPLVFFLFIFSPVFSPNFYFFNLPSYSLFLQDLYDSNGNFGSRSPAVSSLWKQFTGDLVSEAILTPVKEKKRIKKVEIDFLAPTLADTRRGVKDLQIIISLELARITAIGYSRWLIFSTD